MPGLANGSSSDSAKGEHLESSRTKLVEIVNRAHGLLAHGQTHEAIEAYERAFVLDPFELQVHLGLTQAYQRIGNEAASEHHRRNAIRIGPIRTLACRGSVEPVRVLALLATANVNVDIEPFLPSSEFEVTLAYVDAVDRNFALPAHDVIFNAIGDADGTDDALEIAGKIVERSGAPTLNHPAKVAATRRDLNAGRLAAIPNLRAPRTLRRTREAILTESASTDLAHHGLTFPLLLRSPGYHNGRNFLYVADESQLAQSVATLPGDDLYEIEFIDTRDARGRFCKYRALIVGEALLPIHAGLASHWKVHYESAAHRESPEGRRIERSFLGDMRAHIGEAAFCALDGVRRLLALDYGGVDFSLDRDGRLVLFEANATMVAGNGDSALSARSSAIALIRKRAGR